MTADSYNQLVQQVCLSDLPDAVELVRHLASVSGLCVLPDGDWVLLAECRELALLWLAAERCVQELVRSVYCRGCVTEFVLPSLSKCGLICTRAAFQQEFPAVLPVPLYPIALGVHTVPHRLRHHRIRNPLPGRTHLFLVVREDSSLVRAASLPELQFRILPLPVWRRFDPQLLLDLAPDPES